MSHAQTDGTVAVVTGVASPLGQAVARRLAAEGRHLVVADADAETVRPLLADLGRIRALNRIGEAAVFVEADPATDAGVRAAVEAARGAFGRVDALVHVGALAWEGVAEGDGAPVVDLGSFGPVVRWGAGALHAQGEGRLVLVALARNAWHGPLGASARAALGAAFSRFVREAAQRFCTSTVNVGGVVVEDAAERAERALELAVGPRHVGQRRQAHLLADAAGAVRFLASAEARGLCGQVLYVGGGPAVELRGPAVASDEHAEAVLGPAFARPAPLS